MTKDNTVKKQLEEAKRLHSRGVDGDKKAVKNANEILRKLRELEPDNALIEAYYGSSMALLGRDAAHPLEKAEKAQEGLDALHRAVSMDPTRKEIRLLRAHVCLRLPESFFRCSATAIEDFTYLLEKKGDKLTPKQAEELRQHLATAYRNAGKRAPSH
ncbi:hypothetical protein FE782_18285 [Paenibacillus antri]|uniref:Tetratricopeptide repeat protein n=1 Tax=Paenibacillus antri TaxID=2582848 RepID=A0A5R9GBZ1_9BACL|nr:hypothetical protein [Paenibacillus antri]TLS50654.1 hypothetical protein FE782_18285 [Paenibacillus antri]